MPNRTSRREVLRRLAAVPLLGVAPLAAPAPTAPLPGARVGRRPGETAEAFLERIGQGVDRAWTEATGTSFPEDDDAIFDACLQFPGFTRLHFCEIAPLGHVRHTPEGVFVFTMSVAGMTITDVDEAAAAVGGGIRIIEQEGAEGFAWDGPLKIISVPAGARYPVATRMQALWELLIGLGGRKDA